MGARKNRNGAARNRRQLSDQIEAAEAVRDHSLEFLRNLVPGDEDVRDRAQEIAATFQREVERLRSKDKDLKPHLD